jgi:hypothetical protein
VSGVLCRARTARVQKAGRVIPQQTDDDNIMTWQTGPLPDPRLEDIALTLFATFYPKHEWVNPTFLLERNVCRRLAIRLRVDYLELDRWTIGNAAEQLTERTAVLVFGDRRLGKTIRKEIEDFAQSYISDLAVTFANRLFFSREVEANQRELDAEQQQRIEGWVEPDARD